MTHELEQLQNHEEAQFIPCEDDNKIRMEALKIALQIYELMHKMNVLDIPRNLAELSVFETKTGLTILESITNDLFDIAKRNLDFVNNKENE